MLKLNKNNQGIIVLVLIIVGAMILGYVVISQMLGDDDANVQDTTQQLIESQR